MSAPMLKDRNNGKIIKIEDSKFTIGRSLACSLVMDHLAVSRIHCVIEKINGQWCISDSSSNFTVLNDILLKKNAPRPLTNGDLIKLTNDVTFEFINDAPGTDNEDSVIYVGENKFDVTEKQKMKIPTPSIEIIDLVGDTSSTSNLQPQPSTSKGVVPPPPPGQSVAEAQDSAFQEELSCGICTELFIKPVILNCQHSFCAYCINMWKKSKNVCPSCRAKITSETASIVLNNIVEKVVENICDEEKQHRKDIIASRQEETQKQQKKKPKKKQNTPRPARTRGRGRAGGPYPFNGPTNSTLNFEEFFEISSDDLSDLESELLDGLDYDDEDDDYYTGIPGMYYGGYGSCYICHMPGHWAVGCPTRL